MQNYSQTYAATITTLAGFIGLYVSKTGLGISDSDIEFILSTIVALGGIVWQFAHRHSKGDVTALGARK